MRGRVPAVADFLFPRLRAARAENARLRAENRRLHELLAFQYGRMRETAGEMLGMRVTLAQMAPRHDRAMTR